LEHCQQAGKRDDKETISSMEINMLVTTQRGTRVDKNMMTSLVRGTWEKSHNGITRQHYTG
jgi:hypothetical protein